MQDLRLGDTWARMEADCLRAFSREGADVAPSGTAVARRDIAPNQGALWADLAAQLEAAPRYREAGRASRWRLVEAR
jgi:hypothetical protein